MSKDLTTGDVAKYCCVNLKTVSRWINRGQINAYKLPGRGDNRIKKEDFLVFLKNYNLPIPEEFREKNKILIVDDDKNMAKSLSRLLKRKNFVTEIASDGFIAGMKLGTFNPDLVLLDVFMPGLSGFDVVEIIRSSEKTKKIKIILLTGMSRMVLENDLIKKADDFFDKPFSEEELLEKINKLLK
jgi:excisionase family DNA binding protein